MTRKALERGSRWAWLSLMLAAAAAVGAWLASWGSRNNFWSMEAGVAALQPVVALALAAAGLGSFARFRRRDGQLVAVVAILLAISLAGFLVGEKIRLAQAPAIHDVTTNLDDPPSFQAIKVRGDLLAGVPRLNRPGYASLSSYEQWKAVHADAYGDLRPLELKISPAEAVARAAAVAQRYGWGVVRADPRQGALEAVSTTRFFGLEDDIVMRARQAPGGGSVVDVRSVSRTGISDHGRGARNIRRLLSGLQG